MFSFGFWEIMLIGVVALLVVGPERLPGLATFAGQWIGRLRAMARHVRSEIREELEAEHLRSLLEEQNREIDSLKREVEGVRADTDRAVRQTRDEVEDIDRDAERSARARRGRDADADGAADDDDGRDR